MEQTSSPLRVLVIEDERLMQWAVSETLGAVGHTIIEAGDAATARRLLSDPGAGVDVVLLDLCLPDAHDLNLLAHIRRLSPQSRVIVMTVDNDPDVLDDALTLGACRVISKPFDMLDLPHVVQDARN